MPKPILAIDDDHPEAAERIQEERAAASEISWRTFLPPSLLEQDETSHRGALTFAVIILVVVATLTMSYLLRKPSETGDGITRNDLPAVQKIADAADFSAGSVVSPDFGA